MTRRDGLEFRTYAPAGDIRGTSGRITRVAESGEHFRLRLEELLPGDMLLLEHRPSDDGPWVVSSAGMVLGLLRRPGGRVSRVDVVWFWRAIKDERPSGPVQSQFGVHTRALHRGRTQRSSTGGISSSRL